MKHGKKPTVAQKIFMKNHGLDYRNWLVCKDTPNEMVLERRGTRSNKTINKKVEVTEK